MLGRAVTRNLVSRIYVKEWETEMQLSRLQHPLVVVMTGGTIRAREILLQLDNAKKRAHGKNKDSVTQKVIPDLSGKT